MSRSASGPKAVKEPKVVRQLRKMRDKGVLTDDEFEAIAARVRP
jgi:hypothetical protein